MTELLQYDQWLFQLINGEWHHPFFDAILPYWRDKKFWIPFYVLLTGFITWKFKWKVLYFLIAIAVTITIADTISSKVIKKSVQRVRPCNDAAMREDVHLLVGCGKAYSFTSSHAANHFALATFLSLTLGLFNPFARWLLMLWATSIAYAQIYVGVHYPLDVIGGALLGMAVGYLVAKVYLRLDEFNGSV
jgi:membrane-associated phospholipid phosphatase